VLCIQCLCTCTLLSFYTLIRPLSDDPEFKHRGIGVYSIDQMFDEIVCIVRSPELLSVDHQYSCFLSFLLFPDSIYIKLNIYSILLFIFYHVWTVICDIIVIVIYHSRFIACSGYLRLSAYTGVFFLSICRRLSSHLCFNVFWKGWRDSTWAVDLEWVFLGRHQPLKIETITRSGIES